MEFGPGAGPVPTRPHHPQSSNWRNRQANPCSNPVLPFAGETPGTAFEGSARWTENDVSPEAQNSGRHSVCLSSLPRKPDRQTVHPTVRLASVHQTIARRTMARKADSLSADPIDKTPILTPFWPVLARSSILHPPQTLNSCVRLSSLPGKADRRTVHPIVGLASVRQTMARVVSQFGLSPSGTFSGFAGFLGWNEYRAP